LILCLLIQCVPRPSPKDPCMGFLFLCASVGLIVGIIGAAMLTDYETNRFSTSLSLIGCIIFLLSCSFILSFHSRRKKSLETCKNLSICTYSLSPYPEYQIFYSCKDCQEMKLITLKDLICQTCSQRCHLGHKLIENKKLEYGYCICGFHGCNALKSRTPETEVTETLQLKLSSDLLNIILEYYIDTLEFCYRDKQCTLALGMRPQKQEYYTCTTCLTLETKGIPTRKNICLVCAEICHVGHELQGNPWKKEIICECEHRC